MAKSSFLFDENVPSMIAAFLRQTAPEIVVYTIGDGTAPPKGTLDPDILVWIEENHCWLVTNNRASMPVHLNDHISQGKHIPGIIQLPRQMDIPLIIENLQLIWEASGPNEFRDQIVYLPI